MSVNRDASVHTLRKWSAFWLLLIVSPHLCPRRPHVEYFHSAGSACSARSGISRVYEMITNESDTERESWNQPHPRTGILHHCSSGEATLTFWGVFGQQGIYYHQSPSPHCHFSSPSHHPVLTFHPPWRPNSLFQSSTRSQKSILLRQYSERGEFRICDSVAHVYGSMLTVRVRWSDLAQQFENKYGAPPTYIVRAPGRVNILGEHVDYSLFVSSLTTILTPARTPRCDRAGCDHRPPYHLGPQVSPGQRPSAVQRVRL